MRTIWAVGVLGLALSAHAGSLPEGWYAYPDGSGSRELAAWGGKPALVLHPLSSENSPREGFATLKSSFLAHKYLGKRIRFSAWVSSDQVDDWGGLWLRIDGQRPLAFDNMRDRPIRGTTPWTRQEIVLDVPQSAQTVHFGMLKGNGGTLRMAEPRVEVVGEEVPVTGRGPTEPQLDLGAASGAREPLGWPETPNYVVSVGETRVIRAPAAEKVSVGDAAIINARVSGPDEVSVQGAGLGLTTLFITTRTGRIAFLVGVR